MQQGYLRQSGRRIRQVIELEAELRRFLSMAIGSADEMRVWLRYCCDLEYITKSQWQAWRDEYVEIAKMLQGLAKSTARKIAQP
jgi:four helix bundle protein